MFCSFPSICHNCQHALQPLYSILILLISPQPTPLFLLSSILSVYVRGLKSNEFTLGGIPTPVKARKLNVMISLWSFLSMRILTLNLNSTWIKSSTCIYHIFTNTAEIYSKAISRSMECSDHNIVAISRKTKVPKAGPNIVYKRW